MITLPQGDELVLVNLAAVNGRSFSHKLQLTTEQSKVIQAAQHLGTPGTVSKTMLPLAPTTSARCKPDTYLMYTVHGGFAPFFDREKRKSKSRQEQYTAFFTSTNN